MALESKFQAELIQDLYVILDGCVVLKTDANYIQGFPDLLILFNNRWASLEVKRSEKEPFQPNQEYYIDMLNRMSFAAVICPENKEEVLHALQSALRARRGTRVPQRE